MQVIEHLPPGFTAAGKSRMPESQGSGQMGLLSYCKRVQAAFPSVVLPDAPSS